MLKIFKLSMPQNTLFYYNNYHYKNLFSLILNMKFVTKVNLGKHVDANMWLSYIDKKTATPFSKDQNLIIYLPKNNSEDLPFLKDQKIFSYFDQNELYNDQALKNYWQNDHFTFDFIEIPIYLIHVVKSIVNIFPIDQYLAAHYEAQMIDIIKTLSLDDQDWLNYHCIIEDPDLNEDLNENIKNFLKFQRKLYLHYERVD